MRTRRRETDLSRYQSELCDRAHRGRLVSAEVLFVGVGIVFAYWFDFGISYAGGAIAWRLPIAFQILFALFVVVLVFGLPESPRWLYSRGKTEEAREVLSAIFGKDINDPYIVSEMDSIREALTIEQEAEAKASIFSVLVKRDAVKTRHRIMLAWIVQFMNQAGGINLVVYYAPCESLGYHPHAAPANNSRSGPRAERRHVTSSRPNHRRLHPDDVHVRFHPTDLYPRSHGPAQNDDARLRRLGRMHADDLCTSVSSRQRWQWTVVRLRLGHILLPLHAHLWHVSQLRSLGIRAGDSAIACTLSGNCRRNQRQLAVEFCRGMYPLLLPGIAAQIFLHILGHDHTGCHQPAPMESLPHLHGDQSCLCPNLLLVLPRNL